MAKRTTRALLLLGPVVLLLNGCGSDEPDTTASPSSSSAPAAASSASDEPGSPPVSLPGKANDGRTGDASPGHIDVELDDFYFGPAYIKTTPGAAVTLRLHNEGEAAHTFTSGSVDKQLAPGEKADVEVVLPQSGATGFVCRFHRSTGMQGAFFFQPGDPLAADTGASSSFN